VGPGGPTDQIPRGVRQRGAQLVLDSRRSIRDVAAELGVNHKTLRNWVAAERRQRAADPVALGVDERLELARLRRKVAELDLEREILKKGRGLLRSGDRPVNRGVLCEFIAAEKTTNGVRRLCRVFGISPTRLLLVGSPAAAAHVRRAGGGLRHRGRPHRLA
jgi:transposase